jgi:hypothetical protein
MGDAAFGPYAKGMLGETPPDPVARPDPAPEAVTAYFAMLRNGIVESVGHTDPIAFAAMKEQQGDAFIEIDPALRLEPRDAYDPATGAVTKAGPIEIPAIPVTYREERANAYPNLGDFADAIYWREHGNPEPFNAWLAACAAVKATYPKN